MSGQEEIHILLLDGRIIALPYLNYRISDLIGSISAFLRIIEKDYFGITYRDYRGAEHWLGNDKWLSEHDIRRSGEIIQLVFRVRFYVENIRSLAEPSVYEQFFLQAKRLLHKGNLDCSPELHFQLVALEIYAKYGKYYDNESAREHLQRCRPFPAKLVKSQTSVELCVNAALSEYRKLDNMTRGEALIEFLELVEAIPTFGIQFFSVMEKNGIPWWLGLSCKGIFLYDLQNKNTAKKIYLWKHVQNMYYRDKRFSIEVHETKRIVLTRSDFSVYEDARVDTEYDELAEALDDPTTQVSVSRRVYTGEEAQVQAWYTTSPQKAKALWTEASAHYQHYTDRHWHRTNYPQLRDKVNVAQELTEFLYRTEDVNGWGSPVVIEGQTQRDVYEQIRVAFVPNEEESLEWQFGECDESVVNPADRGRMVEELRAHKDGLMKLLQHKQDELRRLCVEEAEITGTLPDDYIRRAGEDSVQFRRRINTGFTLSPQVVNRSGSCRSHSADQHSGPGTAGGHDCQSEAGNELQQLEVSFDVQKQIVNAKLKIAKDKAPKKVRKQRKEDWLHSVEKLRVLESQLNATRCRAGLTPGEYLSTSTESTGADLWPEDGSVLSLDSEDSSLPSSQGAAVFMGRHVQRDVADAATSSSFSPESHNSFPCLAHINPKSRSLSIPDSSGEAMSLIGVRAPSVRSFSPLMHRQTPSTHLQAPTSSSRRLYQQRPAQVTSIGRNSRYPPPSTRSAWDRLGATISSSADRLQDTSGLGSSLASVVSPLAAPRYASSSSISSLSRDQGGGRPSGTQGNVLAVNSGDGSAGSRELTPSISSVEQGSLHRDESTPPPPNYSRLPVQGRHPPVAPSPLTHTSAGQQARAIARRATSENSLAGRFWHEPQSRPTPPAHPRRGEGTSEEQYWYVPGDLQESDTHRQHPLGQRNYESASNLQSGPPGAGSMDGRGEFEKPYEMSDFYKYSESLRRLRQQEATSGQGDRPAGGAYGPGRNYRPSGNSSEFPVRGRREMNGPDNNSSISKDFSREMISYLQSSFGDTSTHQV